MSQEENFLAHFLNMIRAKSLTWLLVFCNLLSLSAQKEDHIWCFGFSLGDLYIDSIQLDTTWGSSNIDFNFDPPKVYYVPNRYLDFTEANIGICDNEGQLLFYSNSQELHNGNLTVIEDTINYSENWDHFTSNLNGYTITRGIPGIQNIIAIPNPHESKREYLIFYQNKKVGTAISEGLRYSILEIGDLGDHKLIEKDIELIQDSLSFTGLVSCKHANGRDWWLLFPKSDMSKWYVLLIDNSGIRIERTVITVESFDKVIGQSSFSGDGKYLISNSSKDFGENMGIVDLFSFDRSNGNLSEIFRDTIDVNGFSNGAAFSLNCRFAYISNDDFIYQYDLESSNIKESRTIAAEYDNFNYYYPGNDVIKFPTTLGYMGLAPDGRIYISSGSGGNRKMHVCTIRIERVSIVM